VSRSGKKARYRLVAHPAVADDIEALAEYGPNVVAVARAVLDDLAHGRVTGKQLGTRRVSGDLTGLARVKFDVPGSGTPRFRLLYADVDASTRGVLAIGVRDEHAIYRMAAERIVAREAAARHAQEGSRGTTAAENRS
jgi:hypothetical protein